jgi:hypothetical protein
MIEYAFVTLSVCESYRAQMVEFLKGNVPLVQSCWASLTPAQQAALTSFMQ